MRQFIIFCIGLFFTSQVWAQSDALLSEDELPKKPLYTDMLKAFKEYDKVYRLSLKGSGGFYGKIDALHPRIDSLINLQYLYVINENLTELPKGIGALKNLQQVYLSGNQLKAIPDTLYHLKHLKRLDLRGNQLTNISQEIEKLSSLEFLYLNDNRNLTFIPADAISKLTNLKYLNLKGTQINRNQIETIKKNLPKLQVEY